MKKNIFNRLRPLEVSLIVYSIFTSLLIIINYEILTDKWSHILIRIFILFIIFLFIYTNDDKIKWLHILRLFSPLLLLTYLYAETDYLNNLIFHKNLDPIIVRLEQTFLGVPWSEKFSQYIPSNYFAESMYFGYFSYYLLIIGIPLLMYFRWGYKSAEKTIFIVLNSFFIYYVIFILFPVVGPQFYFENSTQSLPQGYIFGWLIRTLQYYGEVPTGAFPSSHVSICLMLVWICFKYLKKMMAVVFPIAILLIFSTVYIKAHYVTDVLAGFIMTPIIYKVSNKLFSYLILRTYPNDSLNK